MNFDVEIQSIRTPALTLDYHVVPWDTEIIGKPVAQISRICITDPTAAVEEYETFRTWCSREAIQLCACRVQTGTLVESMFLEAQGFRFVELNYLPRLAELQARTAPETSTSLKIDIVDAEHSDQDELADMAAQVLRHGRFHQDPRIDPALGDKRYRAWMTNAFTRPSQRVLKCMLDGEIAAFFVVEFPAKDHCFWSLVGLAPGREGKGLGKRVWNAMLAYHRSRGIDVVSTSISSHNVPVFNLYVSLGFRFPAPTATFQWVAPGLGGLR
jgi:ribosomal protein S18 acetylase RimI-like enzyme